jgi:fucose permease
MVYGVICLAEAVWVGVNDGALTTMWGTVVSRVPNPFAWMSAFHLFLVGVVVLAVGAGILSLLAGMALMRRTASSRPLALAASFLGILNGPLGIALGVYTLVLLVSRASWRVHDRLPNAA